jgi:Restriction endonuclease
LGWKDFELLCDSIFTQAGWQRISSLEKAEKTIDIELQSPVMYKRAVVQVKSNASLKTFLDYKQRVAALDGDAEAYFVHSPSADSAAHEVDGSVLLLMASCLAELVVSSGLSRWLIQRAS